MTAAVGLSALISVLWSAGAIAVTHAALSGCQVCAQTGDCSRAYLGGPGQYCGNWLDRADQRQSCCCPNDAVCRVSNYACNCAYARRDGYREDPLLWLWWLLGVLAFVALCGGCIFWMCKRTSYRDESPGSPVPVAYPVGGASPVTTYGASGTAPVAPAAVGTAYAPGPAPGYAAPIYADRGYRQGGMGAGTGAALGGAAGLLGGVLLGEAIADAGDHGYGGYDGGDFGGGDAFDSGVGDFGGDF